MIIAFNFSCLYYLYIQNKRGRGDGSAAKTTRKNAGSNKKQKVDTFAVGDTVIYTSGLGTEEEVKVLKVYSRGIHTS